MTLRLFHTSDSHLGHQQYPRTGPNGLNQREQDLYDAFDAVVAAAIADAPDLFVHAGDLFDGVRPTNRALAVALEGFLRLSRAGIPVVVIAGNHETPRLRETGSPFRLFEHLEGVNVAYRGRPERIDVTAADGSPATIHAIPQCSGNEALAAAIAGLERGPGANVLVVHGAIHSLPAFRNAEFNELSLEPSWFDERFDYVALGHYHGVKQVTPRAWYCGAPDRVSMAEAGDAKGFLDARVDAGSVATVDFRPLDVRPYVDLPPVDAEGLDAAAVLDAGTRALGRVDAGAVARLRVDNLDPTLRGVLAARALQDAGAHALHLDLRLEWQDSSRRVQGPAEIRGLMEEFEEYAASHPVERLDRARLLAMARDVLDGSSDPAEPGKPRPGSSGDEPDGPPPPRQVLEAP